MPVLVKLDFFKLTYKPTGLITKMNLPQSFNNMKRKNILMTTLLFSG